MTCNTIKVPGGVAIVCTRGQRVKACAHCSSKSTRLCDFRPPGKRRRCSKPICDKHTKTITSSPDASCAWQLDYCPAHAGEASK